MSTEYKLYNVSKSEMYANQSKEEKERLQLEIIKMAKIKGIKPTARYFKTYPNTVRNIIKRHEEQNKSAN